MLVLEGLLGLHRTIQLQLVTGWSIELDYFDIELFTLEMHRDHSVIFEIASKYCILDSLLTMLTTPFILGILPTIVDIMVIWVKFTHPSPF